MKKIIKEITKDIVQITCCDERWYVVGDKYFPSVTWIASYYPKGVAFHKWLASKGWDEAEAIKIAAGSKGSKVHRAVEDLINGIPVKMDSCYVNPKTEKEEELSLEEYEAIMSFVEWHRKYSPLVLGTELTVLNSDYNYAGTIDLICEMDGKVWLIDYKTGQDVWPEHELQISAYKHAYLLSKIDELGILQLGYRRNKKGYKLTEVQDKFELFLAAQKIWWNENEKVEPKKKDYPMILTLETGEKDDGGKTTGGSARSK